MQGQEELQEKAVNKVVSRRTLNNQILQKINIERAKREVNMDYGGDAHRLSQNSSNEKYNLYSNNASNSKIVASPSFAMTP